MFIDGVSRDAAVQMSACIGAIGVLWDASELLAGRRSTLRDFFSWEVIRTRYYVLARRPQLTKWLDRLFEERNFRLLIGINAFAAAAAVALFPINHWAAAVFAIIVLSAHALIHLRLLIGLDGADQMQTIIWAGFFVYCLDLGELSKEAAIFFVVGQLLISYWIAGIAKVVSPLWRSGMAVGRILRTSAYCPLGLDPLFRNRVASAALSWATIGFEIAAPVLVFAGGRGAIALILLGIGFHVSIALVMGLTSFVFAFVAAYPLLYYAALRV